MSGLVLEGKSILITGASRGIGAEMARLLGPRAKQLVLVARSPEDLDSVGREIEAPTRVIVADLAHPGGVDEVLLYTFFCNDRFYSDREQVRWVIGLPGEKYIYFSKVEAVTPIFAESEREAAIDRCRRLIDETLRLLIDRHFPQAEELASL